MEVLDKDVNGTNDEEEEDGTKKTNEVMPKYLSFVKGVVESNGILSLNVNKKTLQESKIIKVIYKKLVRKSTLMLRKLAEKQIQGGEGRQH